MRSRAAEGESVRDMVVITVTRCGTHRRKNQCGVMQALAGVLLVAAGADAAAAQEAPPPSAIEHALVEYLCRTVHGPTMIGTAGLPVLLRRAARGAP